MLLGSLDLLCTLSYGFFLSLFPSLRVSVSFFDVTTISIVLLHVTYNHPVVPCRYARTTHTTPRSTCYDTEPWFPVDWFESLLWTRMHCFF